MLVELVPVAGLEAIGTFANIRLRSVNLGDFAYASEPFHSFVRSRRNF